jgi:hypothetical protein
MREVDTACSFRYDLITATKPFTDLHGIWSRNSLQNSYAARLNIANLGRVTVVLYARV